VNTKQSFLLFLKQAPGSPYLARLILRNLPRQGTAQLSSTMQDSVVSFAAVIVADTETETFTFFPEFPTEIRLKIWKIFAHFPRDVHVSAPSIQCTDMEGHWDGEDESESPENNKSSVPVVLPRFRCRTSVPAMLHVNHESRTEGFIFYTKAFKKKHTDHCGRIYINPAVDTLLIRMPDKCTAWYRWAKEHFARLPETLKPPNSSPWSELGLQAQVAMVHPQNVGCCAQREIIVVVKTRNGVEEDVGIKEHVGKMGFWGRVTETTEYTELMEWTLSWDLLFTEIDALRRIVDRERWKLRLVSLALELRLVAA
jgi:hypothetical protein